MRHLPLSLTCKDELLTSVSAIDRPAFRLEHVSTAPSAQYDFAWEGADAYLAWHDIVLSDGEMSGDQLAPITIEDMRDRLTFLPQGMRVNGWCHTTDRNNNFTALYFDQNWLFEQAEISNRERSLRPLVYFRNATLSGLMRRLSALSQSKKAPRALTESLVLLTANELIGIRGKSVFPKMGAQKITAAIAFMRDHLHEDIKLEQIAQAAQISVFHFSRLFKEETGRTPYRMLLEQRVDRAKALLSSTNLPMSDIARRVGFQSSSRFSKTFAKIAGMTPRDFRNASS